MIENYKEIVFDNVYSKDILDEAESIFILCGFDVFINESTINLKFDVLDIEVLKKHLLNPLILHVYEKIMKIKSFSTMNGKFVYASFNKDRKVKNKTYNKQKRLAYETFKRNFSPINNEIDLSLLDKIYNEDSYIFLKKLPDNCIDLIVTSPPYNFGIDYNSSNDSEQWNDYFTKLFSIFNECIRVLKDSGRIVVNIQPLFSDYIPSHHIISNFFLQSGMIWKGEILWEKNNYNCKYCTWGSWKSPSSPYLKYSWEYIEIFCKNSLKKLGNPNNIDISADEFKSWVYAKWSIAPERRMKEFGHDAMFPEEVVKRVLKLFSYVGDIVLDPFNGVGTTTKVAKDLNRHFIGIDIDDGYCKVANSRIKSELSVIDYLNE